MQVSKRGGTFESEKPLSDSTFEVKYLFMKDELSEKA